MDQTTKQTALFFGFLAAAMTQVSAGQAAPAEGAEPMAVHRTLGAGDRAQPATPGATTEAAVATLKQAVGVAPRGKRGPTGS
ncbi:hypothetical protein [Hansschlegelia sp.]|uniref:hypothetical protein n=1 Tax=Hansschlegelia sp. TaxID=2041892 RepID=UPI002B6F5CA4|nr:hypothetical protein [Hansschlegelia sp.]HVI30357.1 hypothetical protein [Hansschlegelia sp.]